MRAGPCRRASSHLIRKPQAAAGVSFLEIEALRLLASCHKSASDIKASRTLRPLARIPGQQVAITSYMRTWGCTAPALGQACSFAGRPDLLVPPQAQGPRMRLLHRRRWGRFCGNVHTICATGRPVTETEPPRPVVAGSLQEAQRLHCRPPA